MPETAGDLALNDKGQIVWAGDWVHVKREKKYRCMCDANCECVLVLKRGATPLKSGKPMADHFAYPATGKRTGCTGKIPTPEAKAHCDAKWLIHDKLGEFTFKDVCGIGHCVKERHYDALEWMSTVEKKIPGTGKIDTDTGLTAPGTSRIADVLLENRLTEEVVAIEVFNTHRVDYTKAQECKDANVHVIEVLATTVNSCIREIENQRVCEEWEECQECVEAIMEAAEKEAIQNRLDEQNREASRKRKRADQIRDAHIAREHEIMAGRIGREGCLRCVETNFIYAHCYHNQNPSS